MCGYFGHLHERQVIQDLMKELGIPSPYPLQRAYQRQLYNGLITHTGEDYSVDSAIWWYALRKESGKHIVNEKVTTFNARNLSSNMWKNAIKRRRGLVFATELGESKGRDKYLMRSKEGFALACVYKDWTDEDQSYKRFFAVITRPPHPRFDVYHDKSIPLFIPLDPVVIGEWLDPNIEDSLIIEELLTNPRLRTNFDVTKVKSYKNAEPLGETEFLEQDPEE